jgi:hypothetical protein
MSLIGKVCDARYISLYDDEFILYISREGKITVLIHHMYAFILVKKLHTFITYSNALMTRHGFCINNLIYLTFTRFAIWSSKSADVNTQTGDPLPGYA